MVMQRTRPVMAVNTGAQQMPAPGPAGSVSLGVQVGTGGSGVGTVLAVATLGLVLFYIFTHSIQGSV